MVDKKALEGHVASLREALNLNREEALRIEGAMRFCEMLLSGLPAEGGPEAPTPAPAS